MAKCADCILHYYIGTCLEIHDRPLYQLFTRLEFYDYLFIIIILFIYNIYKKVYLYNIYKKESNLEIIQNNVHIFH